MRKVLCLVLAAAGILAACSKGRPVHQMGEMGADTLNAAPFSSGTAELP